MAVATSRGVGLYKTRSAEGDDYRVVGSGDELVSRASGRSSGEAVVEEG